MAARKATGEVALPVIVATLTTVAAFAPLMFWPGIVGDFMGYLPLTLIITLSSSLFVALVIVPTFCAIFLRPEGAPAPRPMTRVARWSLVGAIALFLLGVAAFNPLTALLFALTAVVLVGLREVDGEGRADEEAEQDARARGDHRVVLLGVDDGSVLAVGELGPGERVAAAAVEGELARLVVSDVDEGTVRLLELSAAGLSELFTGALAGPAAELAADPEGVLRAVGRGPAGVAIGEAGGRSVVALGSELAVLGDGEVVAVPLPAIDAVRHEAGTSVLLTGQDGARAVVTFGG